jgi:hypothetical protein
MGKVIQFKQRKQSTQPSNVRDITERISALKHSIERVNLLLRELERPEKGK